MLCQAGLKAEVHPVSEVKDLAPYRAVVLGSAVYIGQWRKDAVKFLQTQTAALAQRQGKILWLNRVYIDATPSTGLVGPATDVARFMMAYLNQGTLDGNTILQPESVLMLTETLPIDGQGLGWFVDGSGNTRALEHTGGGPGYATIMRLYPEKGLGFAILSNGTNLDGEGLMNVLAKMDW